VHACLSETRLGHEKRVCGSLKSGPSSSEKRVSSSSWRWGPTAARTHVSTEYSRNLSSEKEWAQLRLIFWMARRLRRRAKTPLTKRAKLLKRSAGWFTYSWESSEKWRTERCCQRWRHRVERRAVETEVFVGRNERIWFKTPSGK